MKLDLLERPHHLICHDFRHEMGITHRLANVGVPHNLLNHFQVDIAFSKPRCASMAKAMKANLIADLGLAPIVAKEIANPPHV